MLNFNTKRIPMNIQLFSDPNNGGTGEGSDGNQQNAGQQNTQNQNQSGQAPQGTVFSADYVGALRNESAGHRTRAVKAENMLRTIFGLKDGEELGNLDTRLTAYQQNSATQLANASAKANKLLINSAIKGLEGYDTALVSDLIDVSKVTVKDDGSVDLKTALEELEKKHPRIKMNTPGSYAGGTGTQSLNKGGNSGTDPDLAAIYEAAGVPLNKKK